MSDEVKEHAYQCLNRIAESYYSVLTQYMQQLLELTLNAITTQTDAVARQAISFWSAVCDEEYEMLDCEGAETKCKSFIMGATPYLVPVLLKTMTCQEEGQDEDSYNKSTEASACLVAIATTIGDRVLPEVANWIKENITSPNWHQKEAAVMAFGCIMDGPTDTTAQVQEHIDTVVRYLHDPEDLVKNSSAWAVMRITEFSPNSLGGNIVPLCQKLTSVLPDSEPATANHLCWAIHHAANYCIQTAEENSCPNIMCPILAKLVECLVVQGDRTDAHEANLRANAYEAINVCLHSGRTTTPSAFTLSLVSLWRVLHSDPCERAILIVSPCCWRPPVRTRTRTRHDSVGWPLGARRRGLNLF